MEMSAQVTKSTTVISLSGKFDFYCRKAFQAEINKYLGAQVHCLVLDLNKVSYIDRMGIGLLTVVAKQMQEKGGSLVLLHPTAQAKRQLDQVNFSNVAPMFTNEEDALPAPLHSQMENRGRS